MRPGDGSRTPLLLFNGIGARLEALQPFVDALDPSWEVIRFDVPGIGRSPAPKVPYNLATFGLVIANLLDQLGHHGQVDVMGFSWGGSPAQHFAVQHRRRCRRLILAATATGNLMVPAHPPTSSHRSSNDSCPDRRQLARPPADGRTRVQNRSDCDAHSLGTMIDVNRLNESV